jgi:hypothetical protein
MERMTFLEHYRICVKHDGSPRELSRSGSFLTYKAVDERTGETVALKLIPIASVDPATREQFEEEARAATRFNHVNVTKVFDVGHEEGQFVYASEYVPGDMLDSWVEAHGPMPADAVLRVALQVVSALSSVSFHKLTLRAIQPSNLMIAPGSTPEGDWPFVKLMNFGLAGLKLASDGNPREESFSVAPQFASPEQLENGTVDFRSEVYSLGATMYFLLTGAAPSAELRRQQLRVFPKALRNLLTQMLRRNPNQRPKDPVMLAEMIRDCLLKIERRQGFARRLGIPLAAVIRGKPRAPRSPLAQVWFGVLAFAALLVTAAVVGAFLLPDLIPLWHRTAAVDKIGVPVGVPDESSESAKATSAGPGAMDQSVMTPSPALADSNKNPSPTFQPQGFSGQTSSAQVASSAPAAATAASPNADASTQAASAGEVSGSASSSEASGDRSAAPEIPVQGQNTSAQTSAAPQPAPASQSGSRSKKRSVASATSKRERAAQRSLYGQPRLPRGSMRARVVGTTPDGRVILRLPSGRVVFVTPRSDEEDQFVPRRYQRPFIEREEIFSPPPLFGPDFPPYD